MRSVRILLAIGVILFFVVLLFISLRFPAAWENYHNRYLSLLDDDDRHGHGKQKYRTVVIKNDFDVDIALYFEDGEAGSFLADLKPNESLEINCASGQEIFATKAQESWDHRIGLVHIRDNVNEYSFHSIGLSEKNEQQQHRKTQGSKHAAGSFELNVEQRDRRHPSIKPLRTHEQASSAMSAKFRSLSSRQLNLWYDDGRDGILQGHLHEGQETTTNTYVGHRFYYTPVDNKGEVIDRFTITDDKVFYVMRDPKYPPRKEVLEQTQREEDFMAEYLNRTGIHWRHYFGPNGPRDPPVLSMWPGDREGQVHRVTTTQGYWSCKGKASKCQSTESIDFELEVISVAPRAFLIPNFLSEFEADYITDVASPILHGSSVGDASAGIFTSDTRTSKNTWLPREHGPITETLFHRAADILRIDEKLLRKGQNAEDLQVVHYSIGQKYDSHHDWGVSGRPESRFLTLLLYLNNQANDRAGGETSFPKGDGGKGFKIHPGKGNAVLFYDLLPDGNADDLSLHAALPVHQGEKWLANFWVWDPKFR